MGETTMDPAGTNYQDIRYLESGSRVEIQINRPERMNAFRPATVLELIQAFLTAGWNPDVAAIVLSGAGERAFCVGGDQGDHEDGSYGDGSTRGALGMPIEELQSVIRDVPKPVIAKVNGFAIGGGNVLAALCDLTIASSTAVFGQVGPKVGSVDPGFGTAYLARVVGEKKAREMWYLCEQYSAEEAKEIGLVNRVVAPEDLDDTVATICNMIAERSPTALALAKKSFNADSESIRGVGGLGMQALRLFYESEESKEGVRAFNERRPPNFRGTG